MSASPTLHPLGPDDWERWRAIRLHALQSDPNAFGSTYAEELTLGEDDWRARLSSRTSVIGAFNGEDVAIASALEDRPGWLMVVSMFTKPSARGKGMGRLTLDHVVSLAAKRGLKAHLWVVEGNPAQHLYESAGFVLTGEREELRHGIWLRRLILTEPTK